MSRRMTCRTLVAALVLMSLSPAGRAGETALDAYMQRRAGDQGFSGVVLVARGEKVLLHRALGMASRELDVPNRSDTLFRIGSLTKTFTALATLALVQRKELALDDPVAKHITGCPPAWSKVKVEQLLNHTSGIPDLFGELEAVPVEDTLEETQRVLALQQDTPLTSEPGESYSYSNFNYVLLGIIMEKVADNTWENLLERLIFKPAKMTDTAYDDVWSIVPGRARGYERRRGGLRNTAYDDHAAYAAGGLLSSAMDLWRWQRAWLGGDLISDTLRKKMLTPGKGNYGYGVQITGAFGRILYNHTGGIDGFSAHYAVYPEEDVFIAVLSNVQDENTRATACDLAATLFEAGPTLMDRVGSPRVDPLLAERVVGTYQGEDARQRVIAAEGDRLVFIRGETRGVLLPVAEETFTVSGMQDVALVFTGLPGRASGFEIRRCGERVLKAKRSP